MKKLAQVVGVVLFWSTLIVGLVFMMTSSHRGEPSQCQQSWERHVQVSDQDGMPAGDRDVFVEKCQNFTAAVSK